MPISTPPVTVCWVSALTALARPKSATLSRPPAAASSIRTFSGLTSRWIRPARWAAASAEAIGSIRASARAGRHRRLGADDVAQRVAGDVLHRQEDDAVVLALVEDRHDVGVGQARGRAGLADEAGRELVVVAHPGVHHLDRDEAVEPGVGGLVDTGHAAAGDAGSDEVATVEQATGQDVIDGSRQRPSRSLDRARVRLGMTAQSSSDGPDGEGPGGSMVRIPGASGPLHAGPAWRGGRALLECRAGPDSRGPPSGLPQWDPWTNSTRTRARRPPSPTWTSPCGCRPGSTGPRRRGGSGCRSPRSGR